MSEQELDDLFALVLGKDQRIMIDSAQDDGSFARRIYMAGGFSTTRLDIQKALNYHFKAGSKAYVCAGSNKWVSTEGEEVMYDC